MTDALRDRFTQWTLALLALPALIAPAGCLLFILGKGLAAWLAAPSEATAGNSFGLDTNLGGQINGSLLLMAGACLLAAPIALGVGLWLSLYAAERTRAIALGLLHLMQGIPAIVYGLCGLGILVHGLHWGISLLTGSVVLAVIVLPLLVLNVVHALERIPEERSEAALALGLASGELVRRVWLPAAWPAMLTGLLLAMARALSETAPILVTATVFSGVVWPSSPFSPVTSLQTHVFYLAQEAADPRAVALAWSAASVLVGLVLLISLTALALRTRTPGGSEARGARKMEIA